jgi:hypothetical protein
MGGFRRLAALAALLGVSGCGTVSDYGSYGLVTQDRYDYMTCEELRGQRGTLTNREKELAELIEKANTGGFAGVFVGATTYRSELEFTRAHLKFLTRSEQMKGCKPPPPR